MSMPVSVFYKVYLGNFVYLIWFNGPWLQRPIDTTYKSAKSPGVRSNEVRLYVDRYIFSYKCLFSDI